VEQRIRPLVRSLCSDMAYAMSILAAFCSMPSVVVLARAPAEGAAGVCSSDQGGACGNVLLQHSSTRGRISEEVLAGITCDESTWPDKDHNLVCGECKVLVDRFDSFYGTCNGYCATVGRQCAAAWEEGSDDCNVKHEMTCDETIASSDAICQCGAELASSGSGSEDSSCFAELTGQAADEGSGIGVPEMQGVSTTDCKQACDGNALCQSFTYSSQWAKCWLKDRIFHGGESTAPAGEYKTFYKTECNVAQPSPMSTQPPVAPSPPSSGNSPTIRVVSYNLWWWNAFQQNPWKSDEIVNNIKNVLQADTLGLQECDSAETIKARTGYDAVSPFKGAQGVVVKPGLFEVGASGSEDIQATGKWGPRYVTWAELIHLPSGRTMFHFNTHWCVHNGNGHVCDSSVRHTGAENMLQVIRDVAGTSPAVITGDFNADIGESGPQVFLENGFALAKNSWVDAIFYSEAHWSHVTASTGDAAQSDHRPVIAELQLN